MKTLIKHLESALINSMYTGLFLTVGFVVIGGTVANFIGSIN